MSTFIHVWHSIQNSLFPWLEKALDPLTEEEQRFVELVSLMDLEMGRKRKDRASIAKTFVAKAVHNFETTDKLINYINGCKNLRRLCGWEASCLV